MPGTTKDFQALPGDLFIYKFSLSGSTFLSLGPGVCGFLQGSWREPQGETMWHTLDREFPSPTGIEDPPFSQSITNPQGPRRPG